MYKSSKPASPATSLPGHRGTRAGFTLMEVLVAAAIFAFLLTILLGMTHAVSNVWQRSESQKSRQQAARVLLEMISRDLKAAAFPLIPAYNNKSLQFLLDPLPATLNRNSAFWQASLPGEQTYGDLCEVGYFVRWLSNGPRPYGLHAVLCRFLVRPDDPASIFKNPNGGWLSQAIVDANAPGDAAHSYQGEIADNVIALWITLYDSTGAAIPSPYDSQASPSLRPASAEVALVLLDPVTASRLSSTAMVTSLYAKPDIEALVGALPAALRSGAEIFKTRVEFETARQP